MAALNTLNAPTLKKMQIGVPELGDGAQIAVHQLSIRDAVRLRDLLLAQPDPITLDRFVICQLMCSMKAENGDYLVPENDRVDELILGLGKKTVEDLYAAHLELNPQNDTVAAKKKAS